MKITYSKNINAAYIYLLDTTLKVFETDSFEVLGQISFGSINIDFSKEGYILGFEILCAQEILPQKLLESPINSKIKIDYEKSLNKVYVMLIEVKEEEYIKKSVSFEIEGLLKFGDVYLDFDKNLKLVRFQIAHADKLLPLKFLEIIS